MLYRASGSASSASSPPSKATVNTRMFVIKTQPTYENNICADDCISD